MVECMGYRESAPPSELGELVETAWTADGGAGHAHVLPDGCMDLIRMDGHIVVAGPDVTATVTSHGPEPLAGLRFHPGVLPRLLGIPAAELVDRRVPLDDICAVRPGSTLAEIAVELAAKPPTNETAPWRMPTLRQVTRSLAAGSSIADLARDVGWSSRTLQRQCHAVYGYGPATLRRVLRFRRAVALLHRGALPADVAVATGYADQPHLHREVRAFAGTTVTALTGR